MSARLRLLAAGATALVALPGCGIDAEDRHREITVPAPGSSASGSAPTPAPGREPTTLYLVRDGVLVPVIRRAAQELEPVSVLTSLLDGPTAAEQARGLTTVAPIGARVSRVDAARRLAVVGLEDTGTAASRTDEVLGYAQVVATLTQLRQIDMVVFERAGETVSVPRADGSLTSGPLTRGDYASLL